MRKARGSNLLSTTAAPVNAGWLEVSEEDPEKLRTRVEDHLPTAPPAAGKCGPWSLSLGVDWPLLVSVVFVWEPTSL